MRFSSLFCCGSRRKSKRANNASSDQVALEIGDAVRFSYVLGNYSQPPPPLQKASTIISKAPAASSTPAVKPQPYSSARALSLFVSYADKDDTDMIGPEGFERLCTDAGLEMDGAKPLVFAWLLDAKDMAKLTKDEWAKGLEDLQ